MKRLSDDDLLQRLSDVLRQSRRVEADFVALIGEVDARRLYAREATPSMFAYCTGVLHLSEPEAVLRIRVARASRQHPMLLTMLREGKLHLSGIALLAPLLTPKNRETLLRRATHRSKEEIRELIAELTPRPDIPTSMRKLPTRLGSSAGSRSGPGADTPAGASELLCPDTVAHDKLLTDRQIEDPTGAGSTDSRPTGRADGGVAGGPAARPATVEPTAPERYRVHFTAGVELRDKLLRLQALMRPSVPDGDLARIIDQAVTEKLERMEAKRFGKTRKPRKTLADTNTKPSSRNVPAAIRRTVHGRDDGQCTYVDTGGRRCPARVYLEFHHHDQPFGRGGEHSPGNVRLMCRTHNALLAERDYGTERMSRYRRSGETMSSHVLATTRAASRGPV